MTTPQHLTWTNFKSTVLVPGEQRVHIVNAIPRVAIFGDGVSNRVGLWLDVKDGVALPTELVQLGFINARKGIQGGSSVLELSTAAAALHRQFYHFALAVAERIAADKEQDPVEAVTLELRCFTELLEEKARLDVERQVGLLGELLFLDRLVEKLGVSAVDAWLGPLGEPHDFRIGRSEFEVKTTTATQRRHTIHGTEQLMPSDGCSLCLVSVLLGPPGSGDGISLWHVVAALSARLEQAPLRLARFKSSLASCGLREGEEANYTRRFVLRRPLALVPMDDGLPAITRRTLSDAFGLHAGRIEDVSYEINVEGLETEEGTAAFEATLPS